MKDLLKRELLTWVQYFIITCVAAAVGHHAWESAQLMPGVESAVGAQEAVNVRGMILQLWRDYYRWIFVTFAVLSAARLLCLIVFLRPGKMVR